MAAPREAGGSLALIALGLALLVLPPGVSPNAEGDALYALRKSLSDPDDVLQSWDPTLVNPCTWFHITCDPDNRVTRIDLGNSNLSGNLVPELGKLERLQYLELYKNNLQGTIPPELGNLKSLISLDLYNNNITGVIPPSLGKLKSLVFLRLNDNRLTGPIPMELAKIPSLKVVDVSSNDLCGTIPTTGPFEHIPLNNMGLPSPSVHRSHANVGHWRTPSSIAASRHHRTPCDPTVAWPVSPVGGAHPVIGGGGGGMDLNLGGGKDHRHRIRMGCVDKRSAGRQRGIKVRGVCIGINQCQPV